MNLQQENRERAIKKELSAPNLQKTSRDSRAAPQQARPPE